jgi:hypothetical protein
MMPGKTLGTLKGQRMWFGGLVSALALSAAFPALGQEGPDCRLVNGSLPEGCETAGNGQIVDDPVNSNVEIDDVQTEPKGFSITVDGETLSGEDREVIAGNTSPSGDIRAQDVALDQADVQVRYDGTRTERRLNVLTSDLRTEFRGGDTVSFNATTSYARWVERAEIRIVPVRRGFGRPETVVIPVEPNGQASWVVPEGDDENDYSYVLRVYDAQGRFDETAPGSIGRRERPVDPELNGPVIAAGEGEDNTARRSIPVTGGIVTVSATGLPPGASAVVMGRNVPIDADGKFVTEVVLPAGEQDVKVSLDAPNAQGVTLTREIVIPRNDWFATGLADLTIGQRGESLGDGDSYTRGRLAFYARGVVNGNTNVTVAGDSGEDELDALFDDILTKDPRAVLDRVDPDTLYPTYGDDSTIVEDAPTSGKVFIKVEQNDSYLMWGDFENKIENTEFLRAVRNLYGAQLVYKSLDTTVDGERRISATAYAARPESLPQRDELRGTGGSVYVLQRRDLVPRSETVSVEIVDPVTGRVVSTRTLAFGQDYRIDYFQGTIILDDPLTGGVSGGGVVSGTPSGDFDANLVVQYEYVPTGGDLDGTAAGGRIEGWLPGDVLRLGVTAIDEATDTVDLQVISADARLRFSEGSFIDLEVAESKGKGFGRSFSADGGFTFVDLGGAGPSTRAGAVRVEGTLDIADVVAGGNGTISAYFEEKEAGFSTLSEDITDDQKVWGLAADFQINDRLGFRAAFEDFNSDNGNQRRQAEAQLAYLINPVTTLAFGVKQIDEDRIGDPENTGRRTDIGLRVTRELGADQEVYVFGQGTVDRDGTIRKNNRLGLGGRFNLTETITAELEASGGSGGLGARALLELRPNDIARYYLGYELDPSRDIAGTTLNGDHQGTLIAGAERTVGEGLSYYAEDNYDLFGNRRELTRAYGVSYTPSAIWDFSADLEIGQVRDVNDGDFDRRAFGVGTKYDSGQGITGSARLEYRIDDQDGTVTQERETWALVAKYSNQVSPDWRFIASVDALVSDSDQTDFLNGRYVEASLGYAYRPVNNDRLNVLARYTFLDDLPGTDQVSSDGTLGGAKQRSHIVSVDAIYEIDETWEVGGKLAYRIGETAARTSDDFTSNDAGLVALRATYAIEQRWEVSGEARMLVLNDQDTSDFGTLLTVYRSFGDNAKVGLGYNFGSFSDDLRDTSLDDEGLFLNLQAKF